MDYLKKDPAKQIIRSNTLQSTCTKCGRDQTNGVAVQLTDRKTDVTFFGISIV